MSKSFGVVSTLLSALLLAAVAPAAATAAPRSAAGVQVQQARFGVRSLGRRPTSISRYRTRSPYSRPYRRPGRAHNVFGGLLKLLGIAYLFHLLFGIGAGGSPAGLLLLVALVAFLAGRGRRRPMAY